MYREAQSINGLAMTWREKKEEEREGNIWLTEKESNGLV